MRTLGTVVRGVRAPIFRQGDDAVTVTVETVLNALRENGIEAHDKDVVAITESVVARCQGNYATVEQIAAQLGIPREEVVMAMDAIVDPVSLYEPVYSDAGDNVCVMDQVRDSNNSDEHWLEQISLKDAIARLDKRQRNILALRFCQGKTQMEVSSEIGISQAQVSRLEKSAIACIKREM